MQPSNHSRTLWLTCVTSALRTSLACAIVWCITLYGPDVIKTFLAFPAFSYVTVMLIVIDASLGDTVRGFWFAFNATVQVVCPAILVFHVVGLTEFTAGTTALAVAVAGFLVAANKSTHLVAKRIALGQIVIVYVVGFIQGEKSDSVLHPLHVAASTGLGALACFLALLVPLPYSRLASFEETKICNQLCDNASLRLNLFVKALFTDDSTLSFASMSQAKRLSAAATNLLPCLKRYHEIAQWERCPVKLSRSCYVINSKDRIEDIEVPLKGMELALTSIPSFPIEVANEDLKESLSKLKEQIAPALKHALSRLPSDALTVPESNAENIAKSLQTLQNIPATHQNLPPFFFIFCMELLKTKVLAKTCPQKLQDNLVQENEKSLESRRKDIKFSLKKTWNDHLISKGIINKRSLVTALKCSLSLGLAVLFGLIYSKKDGYWAGLPVAISFASAREATFIVTNVKAQGTVLGTVYGVLGCFLFERYMSIRFISLLPWFIFTSFLQRSRMYGRAGGLSAAIGAVLLLGRKNFGTPSEFAVARITETFIGLSCSIMVELVFQPTRASTLAKTHLSKNLRTLKECICSLSFHTNKAAFENPKRLKAHLQKLQKFIEEADAEPSLWFLPFQSVPYNKLFKCLSKMGDLMIFTAHAIEHLEQILSDKHESSWKEIVKILDKDFEHFKNMVSSTIECCEEIISIKSLKVLDQEAKENNISNDVEMGKSQESKTAFRVCGLDHVDHETEIFINVFLAHSREIVDEIQLHDCESEDQTIMKNQMVLSLTCLGFCLGNLIKETREISEVIKELVQWENPSRLIDWNEISCKLHALRK